MFRNFSAFIYGENLNLLEVPFTTEILLQYMGWWEVVGMKCKHTKFCLQRGTDSQYTTFSRGEQNGG